MFEWKPRADGLENVPRAEHFATDAGLQQIDDLERSIVAAHDEKVLLGVSAEEVARFRRDVVELARNVANGLRADYLTHRPKKTVIDNGFPGTEQP